MKALLQKRMLGQEYKVEGHLLCDDAHLSPYE